MNKQLPLLLPDPNDPHQLLASAIAMVQRAEALLARTTPREIRPKRRRPRPAVPSTSSAAVAPKDPVGIAESCRLTGLSRFQLWRAYATGRLTCARREDDGHTYYSRREVLALRRQRPE